MRIIRFLSPQFCDHKVFTIYKRTTVVTALAIIYMIRLLWKSCEQNPLTFSHIWLRARLRSRPHHSDAGSKQGAAGQGLGHTGGPDWDQPEQARYGGECLWSWLAGWLGQRTIMVRTCRESLSLICLLICAHPPSSKNKSCPIYKSPFYRLLQSKSYLDSLCSTFMSLGKSPTWLQIS